jgi:stage III sporulation protein AG
MASGLFDFKNIASKFSGKKATAILLIVGFVGIALIFLSDCLHTSSAGSQQTQSSSDTSNAFETQTENRLEGIIGQINGVGRVKVLVTVESGVENIYETDNKSSTGKTQNEGGSSGQTQQNGSSESSHVIIDDSGGGQEALLTKQLQPEILGVVIVCDGGNNPEVKESVIDSVSTALNLPTNRISINKMQPDTNSNKK